MSKVKNNEITHTSNSGTSNIILGSNGEVTTQGVLTPTGGLSDNCIDGANIALGSDAAGDIMYYNGTDYVRLAKGTTGHYLKQGGSNAPEWAALSAGKVLQYVLTHYGTNVNINSVSSYTSTGVTAQITPQKSSSKIIGIASLQARGHSVTTTDWGYIIKVQRESTDIYDDGDSSDFTGCVYMYSASSSLHFANKSTWIFDDTGHSTTSAITYTVYAKAANAGEEVKFQDGSHRSQLLLLEVE